MAASLTAPRKVSKVMNEIREDSTMNGAIKLVQTRVPDPDKAALIGIANDPRALAHWDAKMDKMWADNKVRDADEIIIGAGFHAATYSAVRARLGSKPLVLSKGRVGGTFGISSGPAFYLNSGNRPGLLSQPGESGSLNAIPGAPVQPSDLNGDEYQRNSDLGFCIRATLAMSAEVVMVGAVKLRENAASAQRRYTIDLDDGTKATADRVLIATGVGKPVEVGTAPVDDERVVTFDQFMQRMGDQPFPLQGLNRVAVVGAGDGGKVVIEALTGSGPNGQWTSVELDYVDRIDWYGQEFGSRENFCNSSRSRYQGLGRLFPRASDDGFNRRRLRPIARRAGIIEGGFDAAYVDGKPYDLVIIAAGFQSAGDVSLRTVLPFDYPDGWGEDFYRLGRANNGRIVSRRFVGQEVHLIGPAAAIPVDSSENQAGVQENSAAIWRYAPRVSSLAKSLPVVKAPEPTPEPAIIDAYEMDSADAYEAAETQVADTYYANMVVETIVEDIPVPRTVAKIPRPVAKKAPAKKKSLADQIVDSNPFR